MKAPVKLCKTLSVIFVSVLLSSAIHQEALAQFGTDDNVLCYLRGRLSLFQIGKPDKATHTIKLYNYIQKKNQLVADNTDPVTLKYYPKGDSLLYAEIARADSGQRRDDIKGRHMPRYIRNAYIEELDLNRLSHRNGHKVYVDYQLAFQYCIIGRIISDTTLSGDDIADSSPTRTSAGDSFTFTRNIRFSYTTLVYVQLERCTFQNDFNFSYSIVNNFAIRNSTFEKGFTFSVNHLKWLKKTWLTTKV